MRALSLLLSLVALVPTVLEAREPDQGTKTEAVQKRQPNEAQLLEHNHYRNKSGQTVHSPARSKTGQAPDGASAKCRDGTYSFSLHHRGTCSHHGGVGEWLSSRLPVGHVWVSAFVGWPGNPLPDREREASSF